MNVDDNSLDQTCVRIDMSWNRFQKTKIGDMLLPYVLCQGRWHLPQPRASDVVGWVVPAEPTRLGRVGSFTMPKVARTVRERNQLLEDLSGTETKSHMLKRLYAWCLRFRRKRVSNPSVAQRLVLDQHHSSG